MCLAIHSINMIYFNTHHKSSIHQNSIPISCLLSSSVLNLNLYQKQQLKNLFCKINPKSYWVISNYFTPYKYKSLESLHQCFLALDLPGGAP